MRRLSLSGARAAIKNRARNSIIVGWGLVLLFCEHSKRDLRLFGGGSARACVRRSSYCSLRIGVLSRKQRVIWMFTVVCKRCGEVDFAPT